MPHNMKEIQKGDMHVIARLSTQLKNLRLELMHLFPERGWLVNQIIHALITGNNVLIYGPHGTAKTLLSTTVMKSISGPGLDGKDPRLFIIQVDNETTKSDVVGDPNIPEYEETGRLVYRVEGHLPTAHFAIVDEIFDAPGILRGLNDIFNEHQMREGDQIVDVPLMTAIAATNRSPQQVEQMLDWLNLAAFNDRWLFVSEVGYLKDPTNKDRMLSNYLESATLTADVSFVDLQQVVEIVKRTNQFSDKYYIRVYREAMEAFSDASNVVITDRRLAWLTQLVEASAILQGRAELYFDDIMAAALGLCKSEDDPNWGIFKEEVTPILGDAIEEIGENIDHSERLALDSIEAKLLGVSNELASGNYRSNVQEYVGRRLVDLNSLMQDLEQINPKLDYNERNRQRLLAEAGKLKADVSDLM